jgi:4-hydroxybenzoate polyprenyltransferase
MSDTLSPPQALSNPGLWSVGIRAFGYSFCSLLALCSGIWSAPDERSFLLVIIAFTPTLSFFLAYSSMFPRIGETRIHHHYQYWILALLGVVLSFFAIIWFLLRHYPPANAYLATALAAYALSLFIYGLFLQYRYNPRTHWALRYQIICPVLLFIALPFFISQSLATFTSWRPLAPITLLLAFVFLTTALSTRKYATVADATTEGGGAATTDSFTDTPPPGGLTLLPKRTSLRFLAFSLLTIAGAVSWAIASPGLAPSILSLLFAVAVSAYAAVFECWTVTAARFDSEQQFGPSSTNYYFGTLGALVASIFLASVLLPFTNIGLIGLLLFYVHSTIALCLWFSIGSQSSSTLRHPQWWTIKALMTASIFLFLGLDARFPFLKPTPLFMGSVTITIWITSFNLLNLVERSPLPILCTDALISWYSEDKKRLLKHIFILVIVGLGVTFGLYDNQGHIVSHDVVIKSSNAFQLYQLYALTAIVCILLSLRPTTRAHTPMTYIIDRTLDVFTRILGVGITCRLFASVLIGSSVMLAAIHKGTSWRDSIVFALPVILASLGGFALNDWCDVDKDRVNRPYRPLCRGILSPRFVLYFALFMLGAASVTAVLYARSFVDLALYLIIILGIVAYNVVVRTVSIIKGLYTGVISSIPYLLVVVHCGYPHTFTLYAVAVMLFVAGRETWMDIHDLEGDQKNGMLTLPSLIGQRASSFVGSLGQIIGCMLTLLIARMMMSSPAQNMMSGVLAASMMLCVTWHFAPSGWRKVLIYLDWIPIGGSVTLFWYA